MSAPPVVDARGVADLRLWLMDQWRPGRTLHRYAARALDHQSQLFRRPANPVRFAEEEERDLQAATLWWVGAEMVELLMAAAAGIPDEVVQYDLPIPSPTAWLCPNNGADDCPIDGHRSWDMGDSDGWVEFDSYESLMAQVRAWSGLTVRTDGPRVCGVRQGEAGPPRARQVEKRRMAAGTVTRDEYDAGERPAWWAEQ